MDGDLSIRKSILNQYRESALEQVSALKCHTIIKTLPEIVWSYHSLNGQFMYVETHAVTELAGQIELLALQEQMCRTYAFTSIFTNELTLV